MSTYFEQIKLLGLDGQTNTSQVPSTAATISSQLPRSVRERPNQISTTRNQERVRPLLTLQRYWSTSALFAICVFCVTAIATLLTKPVYEPTLTLEIDPPGTQAFMLDRGAAGSNDAEYLETQSKKLESDELALSVIRKLRLDQDPDFATPSKIRQTFAGAARTNETALALSPQENDALITFKQRLKVQRDSSSRLMSVSFAAHDPRTAAQVTNELVSEFNYENSKALHDAIVQSSAWLSQQLDDIRSKMDQSNQALVAFQKKTGIVDLDTNKSTLGDEMSILDQQLASARADRIQLEAQLPATTERNPEALPLSESNPVVQNLVQKLAEARTDLSQAEVQYGNNHPKVKRLRSEIGQLQTELDSQRRRIFEETKTSFTSAQSRERMLEKQQGRTAKQMSQMAEYNTLKKEFQTESELYNTLYTKVKEAAIAAASNSSNVRIIDHARVLQKPTRPRILLNLCIGLLAALFGGVMLAFIRDTFETKIRTPEDMLNATGITSVSVLPLIDQYDAQTALTSGTFVRRLRTVGKNGNGNDTASRLLLAKPSSVEAEAFSGLYTTVALSQGGKPPQVVMVVSGSPGEGKTTIASNLAILFARRGPTCLVDADLRKGSISMRFGLPTTKGLATVLSGVTEIGDVIRSVPDVTNLSIVANGTADRPPAELMGGDSIHDVMRFLRQRFEFVVIDSPPLLPYADARMLSPLVDGLILVGRHGVTTRAGIGRSMEMLSAIHSAPILEIVLNGGAVDPDHYYSYAS